MDEVSKADRTREQIIRAASAAVRSVGPDRVSVANVMATAKLTHGGFYAHFASKDEMIVEGLKAAFADIDRRLVSATTGKGPAKALLACIDYYVSVQMRDYPETACPLTTSAGDALRFPAAGRSCLSEGALRLASRIEHLLRDLHRPHPAEEALSVVAAMVGAVSLARVVADPARSNRILAATRSSLKSRLDL